MSARPDFKILYLGRLVDFNTAYPIMRRAVEESDLYDAVACTLRAHCSQLTTLCRRVDFIQHLGLSTATLTAGPLQDCPIRANNVIFARLAWNIEIHTKIGDEWVDVDVGVFRYSALLEGRLYKRLKNVMEMEPLEYERS